MKRKIPPSNLPNKSRHLTLLKKSFVALKKPLVALKKLHQKPPVAIFTTSLVSGVCLFLYGLHETVSYIKKIVNPHVICRRRNAEYIYIKDIDGTINNEIWEPQFDIRVEESKFPSLSKWWERKQKLIIWRLLEIAESSNQQDRIRAIETIASYKNLNDHDYRHLAQACNAHTAVSLARIKNVDKRFFLTQDRLKYTRNKQELVNQMRDLLQKLNKSSRHPCLSYFLSKNFPKFRPWAFFSDFDVYGYISVRPTIISEEEILPMCIDALVHHCTVSGNVEAAVEAGALPLLLACHKELCARPDSCFLLAKFITEVSTHEEFLEDLYQTGWITVLAHWVQDKNQRLSVPAASCLVNLDRERNEKGKYAREVLLLHPFHRNPDKVKADVVLIHGLLGGVHYTWSQRRNRKGPVSFIGITTPDRSESLEQLCARTINLAFDEAPQELNFTGVNSDKSCLQSDFVFVMTDLPTSDSFSCEELSCSFEGTDDSQINGLLNSEFTSCWPKDWLPNDCKNLRIVGVNYDTRLTDWRSWCPLRDRGAKRVLAERCKCLLQQLLDCGIGERPVIWIAHSMGGLLVKHMLIQAWKSEDLKTKNFYKNTEGIVFLSTPHIGSPWATLHEAWRFFFLPSTEVDELRFKSPVLQKLHEEFLNFVKIKPVEIISFVETKSMKLTSFEWEFHCVPPDQGDPGTGITYEIPLGHMDICKPDGKFSFIYQRILSLIRSVCDTCQSL